MFDNPNHRSQLLAMGLRPDTLFGCVLHFLFAPSPTLLNGFETQVAALAQPKVLKIGIQIRMGDNHIFDNPDNTQLMADRRAWFDCAQRIEDDFRADGQEVIWYLITDSSNLRTLALAEYGNKLVSRTDLRVTHIGKERSDNRPPVAGFVAAFAEMYLFAFADYHVISANSGYGKLGAMWSLKPNTMYSVEGGRPCGRGQFDSLYNLAGSWSGAKL